MSTAWDLAVVGAGPAGLSAAIEASRHGLSVAVIDEGARPGGQIYRQPATPDPALAAALGPDYQRGRDLIAAFESCGAAYLPGTALWDIGAEGELGLLRDGVAHHGRARELLLATGALERPVPVPGWTLPGVMTAGAAQILLKTAAIVPAGPVVLAGAGPLLTLLAWQYVRAGVEVGAILETTPRANYLGAVGHLPAALWERRLLAKGCAMLATLRRAGVRRLGNVSALRIEGETACAAVSYRRGRRAARIEAPLVLLHEGVIPNVQITMALGCTHTWDATQYCWRPVLGPCGETGRPGLSVAGDAGGILGAEAAHHAGRLAALGVAARLGRLSEAARDRLARPDRRALARLAGARRFLDRLYRPPASQRIPGEDTTLVCRCEEVTAGEVRAAARLGARGLSQAKAYVRCGMGACQGRLCGPTVAALIAETHGIAEAAVPPYRPRPPYKPLSLGALAGFEGGDGSTDGGVTATAGINPAG